MKQILLIQFLFTSFIFNSQAQVEPAGLDGKEYNELGMPYMQHFDPKEYDARPDNPAMVQGDDGLMYIGNSAGVLEFDGMRWRLIQLPNQGIIKTLTKNAQGTIFVGGFNELGYLEPDSLGLMTFRSLKPNLEPGDKDFTYLLYGFAVGDAVFFLTDDKLFRWSDNKFKVWSSEGKFNFAAAFGKTIYVQETDKGLYKLNGDTLEFAGPFAYKIRGIFPFHTNGILIATEKDGFYTDDNGTYIPFRTSMDDYLRKHTIYSCKKLPNGWITIGTFSGGLVVLDNKGSLVQLVDKTKGLLDDFVISQELDNQGGLWLGLNYGISRIELLSPYTIFDERLGVNGFVNYITRYNGELFAASTPGVSRLVRNESISKKGFELIKGTDRTLYLLEVDEGLLIGSRNGLFLYKDNELQQLSKDWASALFRSRINPSILYLGLSDGLAVMENINGTWKSLGRVDGIRDDIREIVELQDGKIWLESQIDGVWMVDFYNKGTLNLKHPEIRSFKVNKELPDGWLFLHEINGRAVFEIKGKIYTYDEEQDSIIQDEMFGIPFGFNGDIVPKIQDKNGNLWMSAQLSGQKDEGKQRSVSIPEGDGSYKVIPVNDRRITQQVKKALYPEGLDVLWYGGVDGIIRQDLRLTPPEITNFRALIRKVSISNDSLIYGGTKTFTQSATTWNYDNDLVRFEFAAPSYNEVSENRYQYFLEGYDTKWSEWTRETKKDYTKVPEGDYIFRVRAQNIYKQPSQEDSFEFTIFPPWYRSWWSYALYVLLFTGFLWTILRWRSRHLKAKNAALEKLVSLRTTEVQHQANQLKIQAEKLFALDKAKSRFFANISHEFRTPLTLIKGPIDQLEQNFDDKLNLDTVKMIRRNANRLLNMVNQLLDLARIDEGNLKLSPTEGDVYKCLRAAAFSFNSHAAQRRMDYRVVIPQTLLWASFDRDKLENIVYNLLGNAFKFSNEGAEISFTTAFDEQGLQLMVSDSGKGIAADKLPYIFDRFYQADNTDTREKGGSGIGLSLSKDLVELMEGTITVSSEVGKGTHFKVLLPMQEIKTRPKQALAPDFAENNIKHRPPPQVPIRADRRNLAKVLLVEDNIDMRQFIKGHLIKYYKVEEAINGESGLQKAIADPPDLIITDLMMPKMDGIELCKKLKTDVHTSHIPVIMLTAKAGMENKIEGLETGADDYLTKPFDGKELLARSKNLIEQRRRLRALYSSKNKRINPKEITVTSIDEKFLEQVLAILEAEYTDPQFGVPEMQGLLAMSKTQLHRKLKALTNEAPGELLRNFRLKIAAQLLSQKADSVTQIAYMVGFNNLSYFAKCFKECYGVSPSAY